MTRVQFDDVPYLRIVHGHAADDIQKYAAEQAAAAFRNIFSIAPPIEDDIRWTSSDAQQHNTIVVGTPASVPFLQELISSGRLRIPGQKEGFTLLRLKASARSDRWIIVVAGSDSQGCLWGIRDLFHYHLSVTGDLAFDNSGQCYRQTFGGKELSIPDELCVSDWPRIPHRAFWAYAGDRNICPPDMHDYVAHNPARWIDNMSAWKANLLILWEGDASLLGTFPDLVHYAHRRGVRIVVGIGIFSYGTETLAPAHLKRTPNTHRVPPGQLWSSDRALCPSDPQNRKWMIQYVLDYIRRYRPDGIYLQTGEVDYRPCQCEHCQDIAPGDMFVNTIGPVISAVRKEFGNEFWIISGQLHRKEYYAAFAAIDPAVTFLWESSCFPVANGWANDPASRPHEGRQVLAIRPGNSGLLVRFFMAGMGLAWLDRRKWAINELRKWAKVLIEETGIIFCGLFQTQLVARTQYQLPALFSEIAWNPNRSETDFAALHQQIMRQTLPDPPRSELLSNPTCQEHAFTDAIELTKHLHGLDRKDIIEQFHGIRGESIGDICSSDMMGDVLMDDSLPAIYTFSVARSPRHAVLTLHACLDDVELEHNYELAVFLNGTDIGRFKIDDLPRGKTQAKHGFMNLQDRSIAVPVQPAGIWQIQLKLHAPDGWLFYDRLSLTLNY